MGNPKTVNFPNPDRTGPGGKTIILGQGNWGLRDHHEDSYHKNPAKN
jgi:hypothetical protein